GGDRAVNEILALLSGVVIAVMITANGALSEAAGSYHATVIIHLIGLAAILVILLWKKIKIPRSTGIPWLLYTGGVVGVFTTVANVLTVTRLDVTLTFALGMLGQIVASALVDHFGWLGAVKRPFERRRLLGVGLVLAGVGAMLW
ncbi:MAG: DMT family transporter, partial [Oscillospiraceae bacterium]